MAKGEVFQPLASFDTVQELVGMRYLEVLQVEGAQ